MTPDTPTVCAGCRGAGVVGIPGAPCPFCAINEIAQPATPEPEVLRRMIQREAERAEEEAPVKPLTRDERNAAGAKRHIAWLRAGQPDDDAIEHAQDRDYWRTERERLDSIDKDGQS